MCDVQRPCYLYGSGEKEGCGINFQDRLWVDEKKWIWSDTDVDLGIFKIYTFYATVIVHT